MTSKKRAEPATVDPLEHDGIRYEAPFDAEIGGVYHLGGVVTATDIASEDRLWAVQIYEIERDPEMEDDKQDVFITDLALSEDGEALMIGNEAGLRFRLDLASREVTPLTD